MKIGGYKVKEVPMAEVGGASRQIRTLGQLRSFLAACPDLRFARWSRSLDRDLARGFSLNHQSGRRELGLSATRIEPEMEESLKLWQALYFGYGGAGVGRRGYLMMAEEIGEDSDGHACILAESLRLVAVIRPSVAREWREMMQPLSGLPSAEWHQECEKLLAGRTGR